MKRWRIAIISALALAIGSTVASAQFNGSNLKGDNGLQAGSQPAPGTYVGMLFLHYNGDSLRNRNGDPIGPGGGDLSVSGFVPLVTWVSSKTFFGAHYGIMAAPSWVENALVAPVIQSASETGVGFGDSYVQPINLGWHFPRADVVTGFGMFMPTGRYLYGATENRGLGQWSYEVTGGTTVFFDREKAWHAATLAAYEMHSEKKDSEVRVGDQLTLEGGVGRAFLKGALNVGGAYYAQWKVTDDTFRLTVPDDLIAKNRVFGFGPEVTVPVAAKGKLIALVTTRYLFEAGARTTTKGSTLVVTAMFPFPRQSTAAAVP